MSVITYPTLSRNPDTIQFGLKSNTGIFTSPFDGSVQTVERPGTKWTGEVVYTELERTDAQKLENFLAQMNGRANRCYLEDFSRVVPLGNYGTSVPVLAAAITAGDTSILTAGWNLSVNGLLLAGDRFQVGDNYFLTTTDVNSDASGQATISVRPHANFAAAVSTSLILLTPKCRVMLDMDSIRWGVKPPNLFDVRFTFIEALYS